MKLNTPAAKLLVGKLTDLREGSFIELPSPMPGIDKTPTQAFLAERDGNKWWRLDLYWQGIPYAEATAEVVGDQLILEGL